MTNDDIVRATLIGGPTLHFSYAGLSVLFDPTFDEPGEYPGGGSTLHKTVGPALPASALGPIDLVLLSHDEHPDNLDVAGRALLASVPVVLSTPGAATRVHGVRGLAPWQSALVTARTGADVVVTVVPARHGPVGSEPIVGEVAGFVLEAEGWPTVYVSGDNAAVELVEEIAGRFPAIAIAVLCLGAANVGIFGPDEHLTLDASGAAAVSGILPAARILPVHTSDWAHFTESVAVTEERFAAMGLSDRLLVLPRGIATLVPA